MAKRPVRGKCVHCLADSVERNWDHVFPVGWYPESTPANIDKWKVPSCLKCNSDLGRIESRFLSLVALTLDPKAHATAGIPAKVLRSLRPEFGRNEVDARARALAAKRVAESIYRGPIDDAQVYPTTGESAARAGSDPIPFLIPAEYFSRITEKIVRGLTYVESGKFIEPPKFVTFFPLREAEGTEFVQMIRLHGVEFERGPGITIRRVIAPEDNISGLYEVEFWGGQFRTYATVGEY